MFDSEPSWVKTLWERAMQGNADESVFDGTNVLYGFELNSYLSSLTGYEKDGNSYVVLWQGTGGNVSHEVLAYADLIACEEGFDPIPTMEYRPDFDDEYMDMGGD